jgi:Leucine-rich repeat (LRR) protein
LTEIPRAISQLQSLRELNLSLNYISALPDELFQLTQVLLLLSCVCRAAYAVVRALTVCVHFWANQLSVLDVSSNKLLSIPSHVSRLVSLEDLLLSYNELVELPAEICSLSSLMGLSLHHNALDHRSFPSDLSQLTNLLALDLSYNLFGEIPPQICFLSSLQELVFSYNKLTYVREEKLPLSKLSSLLLLDLSHNQLTKFGPVASMYAQPTLLS